MRSENEFPPKTVPARKVRRMKMKSFAVAIVAALFPFGLAAYSQVTTHPIPRVVQQNGRYALMVDGAPFLMLGAQANNSSDWPATLQKVWPAIEYLHANTLEIPIYWEQFEPKQGQFDYSQIDSVLALARAHRVQHIVRNRGREELVGFSGVIPQRSPSACFVLYLDHQHRSLRIYRFQVAHESSESAYVRV